MLARKGDELVSEAVNAGTYDVILAGLGQYLGTATLTEAFTIGKADYDGTTTVSANVRSGNTTTEATLTLPALPEGASYASTGTVGGTNDALIDGTPTVSGTTLTLDGNGYSVTIDEGSGSSAVIDGSVLDANGEVTIYNLDYSRKLTHPTESNKDVTIGTTPAKLYTTCLPITPTTNDNVKYYKLASVSDNTLNFEEVTSPVADKPYLMAVIGNSNIPEQVTGSNVTPQEQEMTPISFRIMTHGARW